MSGVIEMNHDVGDFPGCGTFSDVSIFFHHDCTFDFPYFRGEEVFQ